MHPADEPPTAGGAPAPRVPTPSRAAAAAGGALVVVLVGGIIGGVLATQQQPSVAIPSTVPVAEVPVEPSGPPLTTPPDTADPSEQLSPTAGPAPGAEPTASPTPAASPTRPVTPSPSAPVASTAPATSAPASAPTSAPATGRVVRPTYRVDPVWLQQVAAATGVPSRAIEAYASATLALQRERPTCGLGWNTLAAIGYIESRHGAIFGASIAADGSIAPRITGPALNGKGFASIPDTDGGRLDGDTTWDRAVGPMQFIPTTWKIHGADGNGDGVQDPNNIDDAALAAGRYLCSSGGMDSAGGWRNAVFGYNRSEDYLAQVARVANDYAQKVAR